ncbi:hypothetical protein [Allopusillimonas ginsengisoli]|uniref:hypothetical protein n=1 Tax=Allopusillimonas ginsengisoli TaxID=453575 RepID=UPI00101FC46A|nr:hypothetical protein [Allopusillimonas ginsengisoli]TEA79184.1 hypothetical protein ERE07_07305 [Allopusillimonas ginsengisoli]
MTIMIVAGPPAVGHNTVSDLVGTLHPNLAVIDVDDVRAMARSPIEGLLGGPAWNRVYERSIRQSCMLARDFDRDGFDVILLDVAPPETLPIYRAELSDVETVRIVLLMADVETLLQRDRDRDPNPDPDPEPLRVWHDRIRMLHRELASATDAYDEVIDNGSVAAEETAKRLLSFFL